MYNRFNITAFIGYMKWGFFCRSFVRFFAKGRKNFLFMSFYVFFLAFMLAKG